MNLLSSYRAFLVLGLPLVFGCCLRAAPIHDAANAGDVEKARALLAANPTLLEEKNYQTYTPLSLAAWHEHLQVVKFLLEKGAAIDATSENGWTPLTLAISEQGEERFEVVRLLLDKGAAINAKNGQGNTPLLMVANGADLDMVRLLLEKGADVDAKDTRGKTSLWKALLAENIAVGRLLLEKGANPNIEVQGRTPLQIAEVRGRTEFAELLRKAGGVVPKPATVQGASRLEITASGAEYQAWGHYNFSLKQSSSTSGWGVKIKMINPTDQEVSETIDPADLRIANGVGATYSLTTESVNYCPEINLKQLSTQGLDGVMLFFDTGTAVEIRDGNTAVGTLSRIFDEMIGKTNLVISLSPKKSVTLVFVFDSPKESKPRTLFWPKTKPIDLK
jgi:ankyrin repeat protein